MTPRRLSSLVSWDTALYAPRNLNAPARWKFSHLKNTLQLAISSTVRDVITGVLCTAFLILSCAARMS